MYEMTGKIEGVSFSYLSGKPMVILELNEKQTALEMVNALQGADKISVKVDKFRKKRSLDANAYCWVLIGKIAEKTGISPQDVYRAAVKDVGGNYEVACVKTEAVESLCRVWGWNGIGWQVDTSPSKLEGCTNVILYYGSSTYDSAQMSRLINIIVQDCEQLGIETKSAEEIQSLLKSWG